MKQKWLLPFLWITLFAIPLASSRGTWAPRHKIAAILSDEAGTLSLKTRLELTNTIADLSEKYEIDPLLILAIVSVESRFRPGVHSSMGAIGLMQVRPIVIKDIGHEIDLPSLSPKHILSNPTLNVTVGTHYFSSLLTRFGGNISKSLKAYNEGPTRVARLYPKKGSPVTGYTRKVLEDYKRFQEQT